MRFANLAAMITVNEYFDGAVKSLAYEHNGKSSVGVINAGEFTFGTSSAETMMVVEGEMQVMLADQTEWVLYHAGQKFEVPGNSSFRVKLDAQASYLCKYK